MTEKAWQLFLNRNGAKPYVLKTFPAVLGRDAKCDICIDEALVSAMHLRFNAKGLSLVLHDLGSTNGTRLDGRKVKTVTVHPTSRGVHLLIGRQTYILRFGPIVDSLTNAEAEGDVEADESSGWFLPMPVRNTAR